MHLLILGSPTSAVTFAFRGSPVLFLLLFIKEAVVIPLNFIDLNFSPEHLFGFSFYIPHPIVEFPKIIVDLFNYMVYVFLLYSIKFRSFLFFQLFKLNLHFFQGLVELCFIDFISLSWSGFACMCWLELLTGGTFIF